MSGVVVGRPPGRIELGVVVARYALREGLRRRVLAVVAVLTLAFLMLYALGAHFAFREVGDAAQPGFGVEIDDRSLAGSTLLGLAMFATLFLGAVLSTFLTLGVIRGDAETGVLQPIAVRPIGRTTILAGRFAAAATVAVAYVVAVFVLATLITWTTGDWSPDALLEPCLLLAASVVVITCLSILVSAFTSSTAQGITVLMLFGAGLTAGLLGQIGDALDSERLGQISDVASWLLPFEALYQDALYSLTADTSGATGFLLSLGPFGGAEDSGFALVLFAAAFCVAAIAGAGAVFGRRDL